MDNGPEFIAKITANWSFMYDIEFIYIQPQGSQHKMHLWNVLMAAIEEVC